MSKPDPTRSERKGARRSSPNRPSFRLAANAIVAALVSLSITSLVGASTASADTLQMSSDNSVTGWYPNEPLLSPSAVSGGDFGELFDTQLDGAVYAQPLVNQPIVLVVTEADYAYGIDSTTGAIAWEDSYGPPADPLAQIGCGDIGSQMGITGTPVIDPSTDVAYFVAATSDGTDGATQDYMEAVNVQTGATPAGWPAGGVQIQGSADGDPGTVFNSEYQTQRPGLVLVNGVVYAAFGSQCDYDNWEGWLVGVKESTASIVTMWSSEENVADTGTDQPGGGIWQSGSVPVVDDQGDIYVATGNGDIPSTPEAGTDTSAVTTYGEAVVELSTAGVGTVSGDVLKPIDFFMAADATTLNEQDGDLGSGGPVALPSSMTTTEEPNVLLEVGKQGLLYVLNMNDLGGYQQGPEVDSVGTDDVPVEVQLTGGVWSKPAVWPGNGGWIYLPTAGTAGFETNGGALNAYQETVSDAGVVSFQQEATTTNSNNAFGYGSGAPIVTSDGTTSGSALVWIIRANNSSGANSQLEAFNPIPANPGPDGTLEEVWSSAPFTSTVFSEPNVDNGIVYVGTKDNTLLAFGALASSAPTLTGSNVAFPSTIVSQTADGTATFTATTSTTVQSFTEAGTAFSMGTPDPALPAVLSAGQTINVPVDFTPNALGINSGSLTANVTGGTATLDLSGQGVTSTATLTASPDEVDFGLLPIGGSMVSQPVTFTNVSGSPISITGFKPPILPFEVTGAPIAQTLGAGDTISFTVEFFPPGSSGDFDHVFDSVATLETGVGNFGEAIEGTAAPPAQITTIPSSLNFGDVDVGSSAILDFDVGDQGGLPLTITESTPPSTDGFSALSTLSVGTVIAADTSIQESVQFAPTTTGPLSATWLVEGSDGNGVQTVTLNGTGVTPPPPPPSPPPTSSAAPPPPPTPALVITTLSGHVGTALALATSGGFAGGTVTYVAGNGTATGCQADGDSLYAASAGTCIVTASEAASNGNSAVSSSPTAVTFAPKIQTTPAPVTVIFASDSSALSAAARTALQELVKKLATDDSITCTGYAEDDVTLARLRAAVVADYLVLRVKLHVTVKSVTDLNKSATTVTTS